MIYTNSGGGENSANNELIATIEQLPCFVDYVCTIEPISAGLSHHCFKVCLSQRATEKKQKTIHYFVKSLAQHFSTGLNEIAAAMQAAKSGYAPAIVFQTSSWLVTEFILGQTLDNSLLPFNEKIVIAMALLAKLHQIKPARDITSLSIKELINQQITESVFNNNKISLLHQINHQISQFDEASNKVLCHGDLNFSNIIIDQQSNSWLIDFECSLVGCAEFELAMFIAVNNISLDLLPFVVKQYQQVYVATETLSLNQPLILSYAACCFLLNGLWYESKAKVETTKTAKTAKTTITTIKFSQSHQKSAHYLALAEQQYQRFDQLNLTEDKLVNLLK